MPFLLLFTSIWPAFPRFHCTPNKSVHPQTLTECSPLDFRRSSRSFSIATGSEGGVPALRSVGGGGWCFVCAAGRNWKVKWKYRLWKEPEYRKHWSCLSAQRLVLFCVSDERVSYTADLPGRNVTEILAENWSVKKKRKKEKEDFFFLGRGEGGPAPPTQEKRSLQKWKWTEPSYRPAVLFRSPCRSHIGGVPLSLRLWPFNSAEGQLWFVPPTP